MDITDTMVDLITTDIIITMDITRIDAFTYLGDFGDIEEVTQALESASHPGLQRSRLYRYIVPSLLVIDEVGYTKLSPEQARHFFELVTAWYEHGSIILTSNISFTQ